MQDETIHEAFARLTRRRATKNGWSVHCTKGLWAVSAPSENVAEREAMHYFVQYYAAGEYSDTGAERATDEG